MKRCILTLLRTGYTTTRKYSLDDLCSYLYPLRHLLTADPDTGLIRCNGNAFWRPQNNDRRMALYYDVRRITGPGLKQGRFTIYNRFVNGDRYGIEI